MDRKLINPAIVQDIAAAIREKGGSEDPIIVNALGDAIRALPQGMGDNTTEVVEAISGEQPKGDIAIANAIAKGATDAAREHVWQGERATDEGRELRDGVAFVSALRGRSMKVANRLNATIYNFSAYSPSYASIETTNDEKIVTSNYEGTGGDPIAIVVRNRKLTEAIGHKVLVVTKFRSIINNELRPIFELFGATGTLAFDYKNGIAYHIHDCVSDKGIHLLKVGGTKAIGDKWAFGNPQVFDLTAMGMEDVVDADDFAHRLGYADAASLPYIPYGEQIVNSKPTEVVSRGRNLWDENVIHGYLAANGTFTPNNAYVASDFIEVEPNTLYGITNSANVGRRIYYDENKGFISEILSSDSAFITPANTRYLRFDMKGVYGGEYKHDVCLYKGKSSTEYTPYVAPSVLPLPLSSILHEGQPLFPQGLCGIGDVKDEVDWAKGKATQRYYKVVLDGTQRIAVSNWRATEGAFAVLYDVSAMPRVKHAANNTSKPNIIASRADTISYNNAYNLKQGVFEVTPSVYYSLGLRLPSTLASTEAEFVAYLRSNPMEVIYELADPIEVTFDPAKAFYRVQNGGTEEAVMDGVSAPLVADIVYRDDMPYDEEEALLTFANEKTGQNDATLGEAVRTLADGYGKASDIALPLASETNVAVAENASYSTLTDFLNAYASYIKKEATPYVYGIVFKNNSSATRAGKRAVIFQKNGYDCLLNERVGYSGSDLSYGCDIQAGCTILIRKYGFDYSVITK